MLVLRTVLKCTPGYNNDSFNSYNNTNYYNYHNHIILRVYDIGNTDTEDYVYYRPITFQLY